jgi:prepilin-type processing-associated H-X9-DG protein
MVSYLLNSVYSHRSARFALERALNGFATDAKMSNVINQNLVMFSERNSEAMNARDNEEYGAVGQDDYDAWVGEQALVRWGEGEYADQGWIRYNRHGKNANYVFHDGHAETMSGARCGSCSTGPEGAPSAGQPAGVTRSLRIAAGSGHALAG